MTTISIISDTSSTCSHVSECGVCYEAYNDSDRRRTSLTCQHAFCRTCVERQCAGTSSLTCPLCRRLCDVPSLSQPPTTRLVNEVVPVETTTPSGMDRGHPDGDIQHREGAQIEDGNLDKIKQKRREQPTENEKDSSDRASVSSLETQSESQGCIEILFAPFIKGPDTARGTWQMARLLVLMAIVYHILCICIGGIHFAPYIDSMGRAVGVVRFLYGIAGLFLCLDQICNFQNDLVYLPFVIVLYYSVYIPTSVLYINFLYNTNETSSVTFNLSDPHNVTLNLSDPQSCAPMILPFVIWMDCGFLLVVCLLHQGGLFLLLRKVISSELSVGMKWFVCIFFGLVFNTMVPAVVISATYVPWAAGLPFANCLPMIPDTLFPFGSALLSWLLLGCLDFVVCYIFQFSNVNIVVHPGGYYALRYLIIIFPAFLIVLMPTLVAP